MNIPEFEEPYQYIFYGREADQLEQSTVIFKETTKNGNWYIFEYPSGERLIIHKNHFPAYEWISDSKRYTHTFIKIK